MKISVKYDNGTFKTKVKEKGKRFYFTETLFVSNDKKTIEKHKDFTCKLKDKIEIHLK